MKTLEKMNVFYDCIKKIELVESVMIMECMQEVEKLIDVKQELNKKLIELNKELYEENKKAR